MQTLIDLSDRFVKLCVACYGTLVQTLLHPSTKGKVLGRSQSKADEAIPPEIDPVRGKAFYLDLIKKQSQEMIELGFLGSPSPEWLATTESQLEELDLSLLQAISQSAGDLLIKAAAQRAQES
jgi:hypothetical protein